jgi:acetyl esterase
MYFHGGGWVLGGFDTHDRLVREIANKANVVIVFINTKIESMSQMRKYD